MQLMSCLFLGRFSIAIFLFSWGDERSLYDLCYFSFSFMCVFDFKSNTLTCDWMNFWTNNTKFFLYILVSTLPIGFRNHVINKLLLNDFYRLIKKMYCLKTCNKNLNKGKSLNHNDIYFDNRISANGNKIPYNHICKEKHKKWNPTIQSIRFWSYFSCPTYNLYLP